jgi:prophage tail gpP-like protein
MTSATTPGTPANGSTVTEGSTILMTGHAHDLDITRYRPTVKLTRTQSGMSTAQDQAEWWVRVARGLGDTLTYTALDWRAGKAQANGLGALWRPNAVVTVTDPYADIDKPMLIVGTTYSEGADGQTTRLRVAGLTAFDRTNEAEKRRHRVTGNAVTKPLSSAVVPLTQASTP